MLEYDSDSECNVLYLDHDICRENEDQATAFIKVILYPIQIQ